MPAGKRAVLRVNEAPSFGQRCASIALAARRKGRAALHASAAAATLPVTVRSHPARDGMALDTSAARHCQILGEFIVSPWAHAQRR
jgi:hypothetical protein